MSERDLNTVELIPLGSAVGVTEFHELLQKASSYKASDILIQSNDYVWIEVHGIQRQLSNRKLESNEVELFVIEIGRESAITQLNAGNDVDTRYSIRVDRFTSLFFRVNMTMGMVGEQTNAASITMRSFPGMPPPLQDLKLPRNIFDNLRPGSGIVLIVGPTGSGKSTLLASNVRYQLETDRENKIVTYESPIEFTYEGVKAVGPMPHQAEIGRGKNLPSFHRGTRNAMRRAPKTIVLGEARDKETMDGIIESSLTGHRVYSTVHADTVKQTINRIISLFPYEAQPSAANKLAGALRMIVVQKLAHTLDGKRQAIREWLVFTPEIRRMLETLTLEQFAAYIGEEVIARGQSMAQQALPWLDRGVIDEDTFWNITSTRVEDARKMPPPAMDDGELEAEEMEAVPA